MTDKKITSNMFTDDTNGVIREKKREEYTEEGSEDAVVSK